MSEENWRVPKSIGKAFTKLTVYFPFRLLSKTVTATSAKGKNEPFGYFYGALGSAEGMEHSLIQL